MKKLDLYIIRKFLGTFFFSMVLILSIVVVFDLSERLEKFIENEAPVKEIIFDYYLNFVPYFRERVFLVVHLYFGYFLYF